jgi:hypothetical protein
VQQLLSSNPGSSTYPNIDFARTACGLVPYQAPRALTIFPTCGQAFGFKVDCTQTTVDFDIQPKLPAGQGVNGFEVTLEYAKFDENGTRAGLNLTTQLKRVMNCGPGQLDYQTCFLKPAVVQYDVILDAGNITFQHSSWKNDIVIKELLVHIAPRNRNGKLC